MPEAEGAVLTLSRRASWARVLVNLNGGQALNARRLGNSSAKAGFLFVFILSVLPAWLFPKTINVPEDSASIRAAILRSQNGDIVEVDDGIYLEDNLVVDKSILIKAKNLYGAVIYGTRLGYNSAFIIKAAAEIEGFIIKNVDNGITQRDSPDVEWTGHDLAFFNIVESAVGINDAEKNVGRARLARIIVDRSDVAFATNDAYGLQVTDSLITNCQTAFAGYDHVYFRVDRTVVYGCKNLVREWSPPPGNPDSNSKIALGPELRVLAPPVSEKPTLTNIASFLFQFFPRLPTMAQIRPAGHRFHDWFAALILGQICAERRAYRDALAAFQTALRAGEAAKSDELMLRPSYELALAAEKQGDLASALRYHERAVRSIENLRNQLPFRIYKEGFFSDKVEIYDAVVSLLFRLHRENPLLGYGHKALEYVEESKANGFLDGLWRLRFDLHTGLSAKLRSDKEIITRRISLVQAKLQDPSLSPAETRAWSARLDQVESEFNNLMSQIRIENALKKIPSYSQLAKFDQPSLKSLLAPDTAIFLYSVGEEDAYGFMATAGGLRFDRIADSEELRRLVENYLMFLQSGIEGTFKGTAGGRRLYRLLLSPFFTDMDEKIIKLVFVPDDILCYLPFEALVIDESATASRAPQRARGEKFLVENFDIAYAPSISYLIHVAERKNKSERPMDLLAVANEEAKELKGYSPSMSYRFPSLSHAAEEVREIAHSFVPQRSEVLINGQVGESTFKSLPLSKFRIIHLAMHGYFNDDKWWRSALIFRRTPDSPDDGLLQTLELYDLTLNADLVVLSACQTGMGKFSRGEGILGLSGAFLAAGAQSVVSSLWTINDESTSLLMSSLYRYLTEGKTKAEALRLSKIRMLGTSYRHPFYWAPFIISGDYDAPVVLNKGNS